MTPSIFHLVLIKPTHYDDAGYPIQWKKSPMPSNTLACLNGLAVDAKRRNILGPDVDIRLDTYDETSERVRIDTIVRTIRREGGRALIALVGVQSNQFPRALDLARQFLAQSLPVCIGGFHISGCVAMLPELPPDIREAQELGISLFAGEAEEGRLETVMRDAWEGKLSPLYNFMSDLPALEDQPTPILPATMVQRIDGQCSSMDLGRGCPFQCSFCTIINVQGHKSRYRSADDVEHIIRENYALGIRRFFITDDDFARNRNWEAHLDRMIHLRATEFPELGLTLQVDTQCHRIPRFIEKAAKAGVQSVFLGLENINPDNLIAAKKRQNKITDYRVMLQEWRARGVVTLAGYILGFPGDTMESILRDMEIIKNELPLDILEFFMLTPLPGSEDHKILLEKGAWIDPDMNKYDAHHRVAHHPKMSDAEWEAVYRAAWRAYYTPEHMKTVLRRAAANRLGDPGKLSQMLLLFSSAVAFEGVHPLEAGQKRRKCRRDRRSGVKRENPLLFYPRYFGTTLMTLARYWAADRRRQRLLREVLAAPDRLSYVDLAITPPQEDEFETFDLYHATSGGEAALARKRRDDIIRSRIGQDPHDGLGEFGTA
jgi:Radical SAM superfamily